MKEPYLMTIEESVGGNEFWTYHTIEAESRQKVKYHFHRTLKDWGYRPTQFGKHCLEGHNGCLTELHTIEWLGDHEYDVLDGFIGTWTKV